jgi:hypothetical protein
MMSESDPDFEAKQRNIALYAGRDDRAENIFTGVPLDGEELRDWTANRDDNRGKFRDA